jgi:hypothetical protein
MPIEELTHNHRIVFTTGNYIDFNGKYLREREKANWHYYQLDDGYLLHCRKNHMVYVLEKTEG